MHLCSRFIGPLIIYDPNDPHASLYDVDDESTIITLADWCVPLHLLLTEAYACSSGIVRILSRYLCDVPDGSRDSRLCRCRLTSCRQQTVS